MVEASDEKYLLEKNMLAQIESKPKTTASFKDLMLSFYDTCIEYLSRWMGKFEEVKNCSSGSY